MSYYWENKETGYIVAEDELFEDAEKRGYQELVDPMSKLYLEFSKRYMRTNKRVQ